jgi:hypothetical protein
VSKADSDTQKQLLFEEVAPEDGLFAGKIGDLVGEGEAEHSSLFPHIFLLLASTASLMSEKSLLGEPPLLRINPSSTEISPFSCASPMPLEFLLVSYKILYILSFRKASINKM